jgi:hypothetical protein
VANKEMKTEVHMYCKNREQRKNRYTNKMKHKGDEPYRFLSNTRKKKREEW